jgi:WD40 repeat protein
VTGWDKILKWKNQEQESLLLQRRLTPAAMEWNHKQSGRFLWNANPYLDVLKKVLKSDDNWFNQVEEEFVGRSIRKRARNGRLRWGIATAVILGLSGLAAAAVVGWRNAVIGQIGNSRQASEAYLSSGQELEAVIEGLRAADTLSHPLLQLLPETQLRDRVRGSLQKVLYAAKERNRLECHEGAVNSIGFSSDGKRFATAGDDGNVCLWDLAGNLLEQFPTDQRSIAMVRFSPDDRHLITGHTTTGGEDGVLRLWDLKGNQLTQYQATFPFIKGYRISFSKDGQQLAILNNGIAGIWDLQGNLLGELKGHNGSVTSVTFSPDGSKIATAGVDGSVRLWDSNRKLLTQFTAHEDGVEDLAFSPDNQKLATAGGTFTTRLWDLQGNKLAEFEGPPPASAEGGWIEDVMFSPNGQQLATVEVRGRASLAVRVWDVDNPGRWMLELPDAQISFSHDSEFVIATPLGGGVPSIWKNYWDNRQLTELRGDSGPVYNSVFGSTSRHLVTAGFGTVRLWDFSTKEAVRLDESNNYVESYKNAVASPDGELLATVEDRPQGEEEDIVRLWNSSGEKVAELIGRSPQFSPDGQFIVTRTGFNNTIVFLWSRRGEKLAEFYAENPVIAFSSDRKQIAIGSDDGTIQLWNGQTNTTKELPGIEWYDYYDKKELIVTQESKLFGISEGSIRKPRLWNLSEGKMIAELKGNNVQFSPKSRLLATEESSDREGETIVYVWDFSGQQVASKKFDFVAQIMFSPDGELLAIDANEKTHLWNLSNQQMEKLTGTIASFSPDGSLILTQSPDRIPRLWNWQGNMLAKLEGHTASVNDIMFSVNSDRLITTSQEDGTIRLWDLEGSDLAQFSFFKNNVPTVLTFNSHDKILVTEDNNGIAKLWRIEELDELMQRGCNWMHDYYRTNSPNVAESDKKLCDNIANPDPTSK